ncbi:MAG: SUMF1/EgtB/PvdO family nonheme iron enzyme [Magnetospirillum sp.]|nr:SUMF1/EgtB/PvdO family nonheme iron enzyme [Magnetospirillum sp.]
MARHARRWWSSRREDKFCHRVYRGGSWSDHAWHLRSATRNANSQMFFESADLGFRLVRTLK